MPFGKEKHDNHFKSAVLKGFLEELPLIVTLSSCFKSSGDGVNSITTWIPHIFSVDFRPGPIVESSMTDTYLQTMYSGKGSILIYYISCC